MSAAVRKRKPALKTLPTGFREPRGHGDLIGRLFQAAKSGRLPHALLFEGPEGTGKFTAMHWFATGLLCEGGPAAPCGECGPCKRVRTGNHPDLYIVDPIKDEEETLRVTRIAYRPEAANNPTPENCIESFLNLCAVESDVRPVLVRECHRMNTAAQNALLKTLEEPRPGVTLILETHRSDLLLDTILSRCVRVQSGPLQPADCAAVLSEHGVESQRAELLSRWAEGSPGRAMTFAERGAEEAVALLVSVLDGRTDALQAAALAPEVKGRFLGATPSAKDRDRARMILELAIGLARDAHRMEVGADPRALPFGVESQPAVARGGWAERLEPLLACRADVDRNVGPAGLYERAFLVLGEQGAIVPGGKRG